jgi:Uma2 family endonuclease
MENVVLKTRSLRMDDDEFFNFCVENRDLRIERNNKGEIIIMSPTGLQSGNRGSELNAQVHNWNKKAKSGLVFDSSTGFTLPNSAVRSPDVAWVSHERLAVISSEQMKKFAPVCPDFVIELKSETDNLGTLKKKMREWIQNGCRLAWLVDADAQTVYIYREDGSQRKLQGFDQFLSGEGVLPGLELDLRELK